MNLVANAVDAIPDEPGVIELSTGLSDVDADTIRSGYFSQDCEPGAYLYLSVRDTGVGMSADQVERIFDPFYSEKQTNKGLGLSSLSGIVRQHRGVISVESSQGNGTLFTVYFPVVSFLENTERPQYGLHETNGI